MSRVRWFDVQSYSASLIQLGICYSFLSLQHHYDTRITIKLCQPCGSLVFKSRSQRGKLSRRIEQTAAQFQILCFPHNYFFKAAWRRWKTMSDGFFLCPLYRTVMLHLSHLSKPYGPTEAGGGDSKFCLFWFM